MKTFLKLRNTSRGPKKRCRIGGHLSSTIRNITVGACVIISEMRNMAFPISSYGGPPVSCSITVHPSDQMSDFVDAPLSLGTSGAIQFGVPATSSISCSMAHRLSDTPKSDSFTLPVLVVRMLAALGSFKLPNALRICPTERFSAYLQVQTWWALKSVCAAEGRQGYIKGGRERRT
jgi:hypothetical protein